MWFQLATNNKMVRSIFPAGYALDHPEISTISLCGDSVTVSLNCRDLPEIYPKKWDNQMFNAIHIVLEFGALIEFECNGTEMGWLDDFQINGVEEGKSLQLYSECFKLRLLAQFLTIKNIQPYEDTRW